MRESLRPTVIERVCQTQRLLRSEGYGGVAARVLDRSSRWVSPVNPERLGVTRAEMAKAAEVVASGRRLPPPLPLPPSSSRSPAWSWPPSAPLPRQSRAPRRAEGLQIAWVCVPQSRGAGGFTTIARLASSLEAVGHRCTIYLADRHGWSFARHRRTMRAWWPDLKAEIRDFADGVEDAHAVFATSWETAYSVLASPAKGVRFYLVQDFEPLFYPAGSEALLAEATYRFGFHGVTVGPWLARRLEREYGMAADWFSLGCDRPQYRIEAGIEEGAGRTGVCMYARPSTPRRAFELGVAALEMFAARMPDVDIHLFGEPAGRLPFAAADHGLMTPGELSGLYNRCVAGLVLSATNVSLVPFEMLAAGCIPVVNDVEHNREVLDNPAVAYAEATPWCLAEALVGLVERTAAERAAAAREAAASVSGASWEEAGTAVEKAVRGVVERVCGETYAVAAAA